MGFPSGSAVKIFLQCRRQGFDPQVRKIPWRRKWKPTPVFLPGESHGQRSLVCYSPLGHKQSNTTEQLTHTHNPTTAFVPEGKWAGSKRHAMMTPEDTPELYSLGDRSGQYMKYPGVFRTPSLFIHVSPPLASPVSLLAFRYHLLFSECVGSGNPCTPPLLAPHQLSCLPSATVLHKMPIVASELLSEQLYVC